MSKKRRDRHKKGHQEPQFDFDEAKDLTVGQVIRKNEEVEAGVLPEDSILDKYIKQHREEIEADKFETRQFKKEELASTQSLEDMIQEVRESSETSEEIEESHLVTEEVSGHTEETEAASVVLSPLDEENQELEPLVLTNTATEEETESPEEEEVIVPLSRSAQTEPETGSKKKGVIIIASVVAAILVLAGTYYVYRQVSRSNQEIQSSQAASSDDKGTQTALKDFNDLYDTFYTDANKTALKNSQFDKLSQLKTLLDKLEGSRDYTLAKSRYDSLATQIKAIQDVNALFESPAITDGVLDTNAKAKADAKFTEIKTGNTELDKLLDKAISLGKSQQTSASSSSSSSSTSQASSSSATESNASSTTPSTSTTAPARDTNGGLSGDGVNLQRSTSRVPYNQSAVDDSNNPAWTFADGVLEQVLATSRARGYITGNQYILERVNIVNGNGYYNLYKPDGTYLFTLNCKTGYFVGNGSGHADDLDY
ncbi:cell division site-positioning protein MapZ [Streptococcus oralis]|uniref:cell division site-positioning protein MapZ n=1 Tax=Streptococcus oralis TaxID=1303 RepID=UPI0020005FD3|nr:cell division site-positioning protein MapZ family protein [Streptococcus oralis]